MVMDALFDRRLTVNQIANAVGISRERVGLEHSARQTWHVEGFRSVGATAFHAWSKAHQASQVAGELGTF